MAIPNDALHALHGILLHAEENQLTLIEVTRKDSGAVETLLCCQMIEGSRVTIVPVALMLDIGSVHEQFKVPTQFGKLVSDMSRHDIAVSFPGMETEAAA
jgi:hypothetical protein